MNAARTLNEVFVVEVPIRTVAEHNAHEDYWMRVKRARGQHEAVLKVLDSRSLTCPFPFPIRVTLTRQSFGRLDTFDNLPSSMKHVADAVAWWARGKKGKIGQADRNESEIEFVARQEKAPKGTYGVRIEIAPRGAT